MSLCYICGGYKYSEESMLDGIMKPYPSVTITQGGKYPVLLNMAKQEVKKGGGDQECHG